MVAESRNIFVDHARCQDLRSGCQAQNNQAVDKLREKFSKDIKGLHEKLDSFKMMMLAQAFGLITLFLSIWISASIRIISGAS